MHDYSQWLGEVLFDNECYTKAEINVCGFLPFALSEGIGIRNCIFVQGCSNFCPGCKNLAARKIKLNKLFSPQSICEHLAHWKQVSLSSSISVPQHAYSKFLHLECLKHVAWKALKSSFSFSEISGVPTKEYYSSVFELLRFLSALCRGHLVEDAPSDWISIDVNGITISGGEPLLQLEAIKSLILHIRRTFPEWDICLYTGTSNFNNMIHNKENRNLLEMLDTIKIGPYIKNNEDVLHPYFGSTNQLLLNARKSLESGKPIAAKLPNEVLNAITLRNDLNRQQHVPVVKREIIKLINEIPLNISNCSTLEQFEYSFFTVDNFLYDKCFDFIPHNYNTFKYAYLDNHELNILGIKSTPLRTTEHSCYEIYLQGSHDPPPFDIGPGLCELIPRHIIHINELYDLVGNSWWSLKTNLAGDDAERMRLNLALQDRLLEIQASNYLLTSPFTDFPLLHYLNIVNLYRIQMQLLFSECEHNKILHKKAIFIRGGDAFLQAKALILFIELFNNDAMEIWLETTRPLHLLSRSQITLKLLHSCDFVVSGNSCDREPPSVLPFKSSRNQVIYNNSNIKWTPRYIWSQQINQFEKRFSNSEAISKFHLSKEIVTYFSNHKPNNMSVEELEYNVGNIYCDWTNSDSCPYINSSK